MSPRYPNRRTDLEIGELQQGDEVVLLDPGTQRVVSLNAAAAAVWYLCDGTRDLDRLLAAVLEAFPGLSEAEARPRVEAILGQLGGQALLQA